MPSPSPQVHDRQPRSRSYSLASGIYTPAIPERTAILQRAGSVTGWHRLGNTYRRTHSALRVHRRLRGQRVLPPLRVLFREGARKDRRYDYSPPCSPWTRAPSTSTPPKGSSSQGLILPVSHLTKYVIFRTWWQIRYFRGTNSSDHPHPP